MNLHGIMRAVKRVNIIIHNINYNILVVELWE